MKSIFFIIILFISFNTIILQSQTLIQQSPQKITKKEVRTDDYNPIEFSRKNQALIKKKIGDRIEYFLTNKGNVLDSINDIENQKLFSFNKDDQVQYMQFSKSNGQVVFRKLKNGKKVWDLYDIDTKQLKEIESDEGSVDAASIYDMSNILYRTYLDKDRSKIYLIRDDKDPVFIDYGFGVQWSNDMKYFLCETYQNNELSLFEKKRYGLINQEEYKKQLKVQSGPKREIFSRYAIFNSDGEKLLVLQDFDLVDWIQWSPDNSKIVLQERYDPGFKIIYLNYISENQIEIEKVYHFPGFQKVNREISTFCKSPIWSPDGNKLLFTTNVEDGYTVLYNNVYILLTDSNQFTPVIETDNVIISSAEWISSKSFLINLKNKDTKENFNYEMNID